MIRPIMISLVFGAVFSSCSQIAMKSGYQVEKPESVSTRRSTESLETDQGSTGDLSKDPSPDPVVKPGDPPIAGPDPKAPMNPPAVIGTPVPATGSLTVSLSVIPPVPAGNYRNRGHVRAVWVTDANDKYLRTIHAFAGVRAANLRRWFSFTNATADGTTGATQITPAAGFPLSTTWDLKDKAGQGMMTGNYKLWLEFDEANTPLLDQGKKASDPLQAIDAVAGYEFMIIPFTLTPQASMKTDASNAVFKDVVIKHNP